MSTMSDPLTAEDRPDPGPKSIRRRRLRLWMLMAIVPAVAIPLGLKRRWDGFREDRIDHERNAVAYAQVAAIYRKNVDMFASSAELSERMAESLGKIFGALQRKQAEDGRRHEAEARAQESYYLKTSEEERRLADEARRRW